ncbi:hypothetical protein [Streptomyces sp. NBC_00285]|uniref:hypothetical protein n=1 Tax=Streptomyces sp. NBC_00285 TaxID=2975700 RepID=UPI003FA6FDAD
MSVMVDIRSVHKSFGPLKVHKGIDLEQGPPAGVLDNPRHERTRDFLPEVL